QNRTFLPPPIRGFVQLEFSKGLRRARFLGCPSPGRARCPQRAARLRHEPEFTILPSRRRAGTARPTFFGSDGGLGQPALPLPTPITLLASADKITDFFPG